MFGKRKRATRAELEALRQNRDALEKEAKAVSKEADDVTDSLLDDYEQVEKQRERNGGR